MKDHGTILGAFVSALMLFMPIEVLAQAPAMKAFDPPGGKGRGVLIISGQNGPAGFEIIAKEIADQGFNAALIDGNDVFKPNTAGEPAFLAAVAALQSAPKTLPGKIGVVGFSLGGGAALTYAARMGEKVAVVVVHYPFTAFITKPDSFVGSLKVPILMLVGVKDVYKSCCLIGMARALADSAKKATTKPSIELVEYPEAEHGFNLKGPTFRAIDSADALKRTVAFLSAGLSEPAKK